MSFRINRKIKISWLLYIFLMICTSKINAQSSSDFRGIPYYQTYQTGDYPGEQQMFDVLQWHDGSMLFANAGGLVQHADDDWRIFARFDATFISEIEAGRFDSTLIWSGSYSNLGYFIQNGIGEFEYFSLSEKVPVGYSNFSDVHLIKELDDRVLFFSDLYLFSYSKVDSSITVIEEMEYEGKSSRPTNYLNWRGVEYYFLLNGDIIKETDGQWGRINNQGIPPSQVLYSEVYEDVVYLVDLELGLLLFDGEIVQPFAPELKEFIRENSVGAFTLSEDNHIVVTTDAGVIVLNTFGDLEYVFNEEIGIPENEINAVIFDKEGDLWILGEATVTQVYLSNPVRHFPGNALGFGDALHIREYDGSLVIPAMEGLFRIDQPLTNLIDASINDIVFKYDLESTFWNSLIVDDEIWVASHDGVFVVNGDQLSPIVLDIEARQLRRLSDNIIMIVTYNGLDWLSRDNGSWNYRGTLETVPEHILELAVIPGKEFWAGGVSGVVFRGILNDAGTDFEIRKYNSDAGLPDTDMFEPTFTDGEIIINSKYGFYQFDRDAESFSPIKSINDQLGNWGEYLRMDQYGTLWTLYANIEGYSGVIEIEPDKELEWRAKFTPFEISTDHFGDFVEINGNTLWVGSTESLLQMDITKEYIPSIPEISLWSIRSNFDQEFLSYSVPVAPAIGYDQKDIQLKFVSSSYRYPSKNEFRFKLGNDEWSEWRQESAISINPLLPGQKIISVQTRDFMLAESDPVVFMINIIAPWYLSNTTYLIYAVMLIGIFISAVRWVAGYRIQQQMNQIKLKEIERIIELDEMKTKLLINISHELRTPLTLVTGPVKQLLDSEKVHDDFLLHKLQVAHRNGRRLHELVEQVLDLSRLDSNIVQFNPVEIPLNKFIHQVVESFETATEKKSLIVTENLPEQEIILQADVDKFEKILVNLLSNAIKFTPDKGSIVLTLIDAANEIQIEVIDSGRGINPVDLEHVFDRFHSTSDLLEGGGQGIGVGLSITKEFVELHEGYISVESEIGKGSVFKIVLPKKEYEEVTVFINQREEISEIEEISSIELSAKGNKYSALVVEDNPDMRDYVSELLSQLNIKVDQANNGAVGKLQMSKHRPDIVISDVMMPEMNGFEFAHWMRSTPEYKQIPIILLSARSEVEDKVHGFQIGVSDYLTKPFSAQELQARVDNLLVLKNEREEAVAMTNEQEQPLDAESELLQRLQEFVELKLDNSNIGVDDLANHVAMSARNLQRMLKEITGFTPIEFIREIRLFAARDLLETKQKRSISEIAYAVGFSTPSYFSKLYKKRFGASPSSYF